MPAAAFSTLDPSFEIVSIFVRGIRKEGDKGGGMIQILSSGKKTKRALLKQTNLSLALPSPSRYWGEEDDHVSVASRKMTHYAKTDCVGASKGLFFGLLTLICGLICLILFFVLIDHNNSQVQFGNARIVAREHERANRFK